MLRRHNKRFSEALTCTPNVNQPKDSTNNLNKLETSNSDKRCHKRSHWEDSKMSYIVWFVKTTLSLHLPSVLRLVRIIRQLLHPRVVFALRTRHEAEIARGKSACSMTHTEWNASLSLPDRLTHVQLLWLTPFGASEPIGIKSGVGIV